MLNDEDKAGERSAFSIQRSAFGIRIVWVLFLFSGACGLIYEVLWCRQLGLLFGNTVESLSAVLSAFMGGLALGSYCSGRVCHRFKRPLVVYGILELLIGLYCAALPWAFGAHSPLVPLYRSLYGESGGSGLPLTRFLISFVLLLVPTTFMGATLPVLSQFFVRSKQSLGRTVGALYAVNTFGAVAGAVLAGFVLLPNFGKAESNWIAVACNVTLGVLAILCGSHQPSAISYQPTASSQPPTANNQQPTANSQQPLALRLTILSFGLTGFAALATQIGWTRAISLATGSSTYAFSLIVSVFILGLSLGGVWGARIAPKLHDPLAMLARVLLAIGFLCMALTVVLGYGPKIFFVLLALGSAHDWSVLLLFQALGIALLIIGPTFLMGATMPLTMQVASRSPHGAGRTVGTIYAVNTVGSILGSLLGGLVLLPLLQIKNTLALTALLYTLPGLVLFAFAPSRQRRGFVVQAGVAALTVLVLLVGGAWDPVTMSSGAFLLRDKTEVRAAREFRLADALPDFRAVRTPLYYSEGAEATVAVMRIGDELSLSVGGKPDATSYGDMSTQVTLTLVPEILHAAGPEDVLVIGLGSGASAGCALTPDAVQRVDVAEMSPGVVEASYYFREFNGLHYETVSDTRHPLNTPRLNLILNDARNHLLLTSRAYDVISSEPSNPWLAGVGNLFTQEAFALARAHLKPGGVMCQWVHSYALEEEHFFSIVKTFGTVFPHLQLWCVNRGDFLLIGSDAPLEIPFARLHERLRQPRVAPWLAKVHLDTEAEFLACYLTGEEDLRAAAENAPLHTDDNMLLEFSAPRALYGAQRPLRSTQFLAAPEDAVDLRALPAEERGRQIEALDLSASAWEHMRCRYDGLGPPQEHLLVAAVLAPNQLWVTRNLSAEQIANAAKTLKDAEHVLLDWPRPVSAKPEAQAALTKGEELGLQRKTAEALAEVQRASALGGEALPCTQAAGDALFAAGRYADGLATVDNVLKNSIAIHDPATVQLWRLRAQLQAGQDDVKGALSSLGIALALKPDDIELMEFERQLLTGHGHAREAIALARHTAALAPANGSLKIGLFFTLLRAASEAPADKPPAATLRLLRYARRISTEYCALAPDFSGWELRCHSWLALAKAQPDDAAFCRQQAKNAFDRALELAGGDTTKLNPSLVEIFKHKN